MAQVWASLTAEPAWFSVIGLALDILAIIALAWDLVLARKGPIHSGSSHVGEPAGDADFKAPLFMDRVRQSKITLLCVLVLVVGFLLQLYGVWPR